MPQVSKGLAVGDTSNRRAYLILSQKISNVPKQWGSTHLYHKDVSLLWYHRCSHQGCDGQTFKVKQKNKEKQRNKKALGWRSDYDEASCINVFLTWLVHDGMDTWTEMQNDQLPYSWSLLKAEMVTNNQEEKRRKGTFKRGSKKECSPFFCVQHTCDETC